MSKPDDGSGTSNLVEKRCSMCGEAKLAREFARCSTSRDGLYSRCRDCSNAASRAYAAANRERILERKRAHSAANRDEERLRSRAWYAANREHALVAAAAYRREHADEIRDKHHEYRRTHADACRRRAAMYYRLYRDERRAACREWYRRNRDVALEQAALYRKANADAIREARHRWFDLHPDYKAEWYKQNKRRWHMYNKRSRLSRLDADPVRYSLETRVGRALRKALNGAKAGRSSFVLLGYSREELVAHLEQRFLPGMTWDNMAEWHIDHVIPKSWFRYASEDDEAFRECWGLENLQPLWGRDNLSKGNRRSG